MKHIFDFDCTLGHLMDLSLHPFKKVQALFDFLTRFWYTNHDGSLDEERWKNVRIGTCKVYLDDNNCLHLDFATRFSLKDDGVPKELFEPEPPGDLEFFLNQIKKSQN